MLLNRWALAVIFLTFATLCYRFSFAVSHQTLFSEYNLWDQNFALFWGLRFDIAVAMPMALLSLIMYRVSRFFVSSSWHWYVLLWLPVFFIIHTGDTLYYQDSGRHIGHEVLSANGDVMELIQHAFHTGFALILSNIVLLGLLALLWVKYTGKYFQDAIQMSLMKQIAFSVVMLLVTVVGVRGGVSGVPQSPIHAYKIGDANLAIIASNPSYIALAILSTKNKGISQIALPPSTMQPDELLLALYPEPHRVAHDSPEPFNIIFIFLESWNAAFMQSYNSQETLAVTPVFDAFRANALTSDITLAGGHRTVEGVFASMCSLQNPLGTSIADSQLLHLPYLCFPEVLNKQGYFTSFMQGSYRDTASVGSFAQRLGFQESLGKVELPKGKIAHNSWGLQDDDLYDALLDKALLQKEPFFFAVNTTSTHDTVVPPHATPLLDARTNEEKHKNVMHYADEAFGRFLQRFHHSPLAKNTILVAMADHTAQIHSSYLHEYMVPMAIQVPQMKAKRIPYATSQRDIAPTLLELLQLPPEPSFSGKSLLSSDVFFADYYHHQHLGWIEGDYLLSLILTNGDEACFLWRQDLALNQPISCEKSQHMKQRGLGFTSMMQEHLFSGTTKQFLERKQP